MNSVSVRLLAISNAVLALSLPLSISHELLASECASGLNGEHGSYEQLIEALRTIGSQTVVLTKSAPTASMATLLNGQLTWRSSIKNVQVKFVAEVPVRPNKKLRDTPIRRDTTARFLIEYAEKGTKAYRSYTGLDSSTEVNAAAPTPDFVYAFNDRDMREINMGSRTGSIQRKPSAVLADLARLLFEAISYPIGDDKALLVRTDWYVPAALESEGRYGIRPQLELVDGFPCHVVSSGHDTMWLDAEHACCMRRRVLFRRTSSNDECGVLQALYECTDFEKHTQDVWLPNKVVRFDFATQERPASERGKVTGTNSLSAIWSVNQVADSIFEVEFPPGFLVLNNDNETQLIAPAGEHLLDDAIKSARRMPAVTLMTDSSRHRPSSRFSMLVMLNIVAIVVIAVLLARKYKRQYSGK